MLVWLVSSFHGKHPPPHPQVTPAGRGDHPEQQGMPTREPPKRACVEGEISGATPQT